MRVNQAIFSFVANNTLFQIVCHSVALGHSDTNWRKHSLQCNITKCLRLTYP